MKGVKSLIVEHSEPARGSYRSGVAQPEISAAED